VASFPEVVPAGGRAEIKVVVKTKGYGGRNLHKRFVVHTNDRKHPKTILMVRGHVKAFAKLEPRYLRIVGQPGQKLEAAAKLWPLKEFPFKVTSVEAKSGKDIKVNIEPLVENGRRGYLVKVELTRKVKGGFRDTVLIHTDSKQKPVIRLQVFGYLKEAPKGNAASGPSKTK